MMNITNLSIVLLFSWVQLASAEIIGVAGGTAAPAPTLGPYPMTVFPVDDRPLLEMVTFVPSPLGGELAFSDPMLHLRVDMGWPGWPHEYPAGDVYSSGSLDAITLTLPPETYAFYFYAGRGQGSSGVITAQADDGPSVSQLVHSFGESYFGFYVDDLSEGSLETITIVTSGNFAIGEFGIAVPEPTSAVLLVAGTLALVGRRR